MPGVDPEVIISTQEETGYLKDTHNDKVITKEESLIIWSYLYKNKNLVGKMEIEDPIKKFINTIIHIYKNDAFGNKELFKYMVSDIKEEKDDENISKYRLYIQDINDPTQEVEKSKTLLSVEQLKLFIEENRKKD